MSPGRSRSISPKKHHNMSPSKLVTGDSDKENRGYGMPITGVNGGQKNALGGGSALTEVHQAHLDDDCIINCNFRFLVSIFIQDLLNFLFIVSSENRDMF